jgi:hypothetical protein
VNSDVWRLVNADFWTGRKQMKRFNDWLDGRLFVASALCAAAESSIAHSGHQVPAGVSAQQHWHLFDQTVVSPSGLIVVGITTLALAVFAVKKQRQRSKAD